MAYEYSGIYRPGTAPPDGLIASKVDIPDSQLTLRRRTPILAQPDRAM